MKKGLLTFIAASAFCLGAGAQTQYIMKVTKTNGQTELINADEVESVSFEEGALSPKVMMVNEIRNSLYGIASRKMNPAAHNLGTTILADLAKIVASDEGVVASIQQDVMGKVTGQVKPVEEGSELAKAGYEKYAVIDYKMFDGTYSFDARGGMTKGEADGKIVINFPVDVDGFNGNVSTAIAGSGNVSEMLVTYAKDKTMAFIIRLPEAFNLTVSSQEGANLFDGKMSIAFEKKSEGSSYFRPLQDKWTIGTELNAHLKELNEENALTTSVSFDGSTGIVTSSFGFEMNGRKVIERKSQATVPVLAQLSYIIPLISNMIGLNSGSPIDIISQLLASGNAKDMINGISAMLFSGANIDNYEVTLLDDLTISVSVRDIYATSQIVNAMEAARRNGADEATISQYAEQLNSAIKLGVKVKKLNAELPAKLVATQIGVDYTLLPAVSFDGQEYTSVLDLLDIKSAGYIINTVDHCMEPLSATVSSLGIVVGNLMKLFTMQSQEEQPAAAK